MVVVAAVVVVVVVVVVAVVQALPRWTLARQIAFLEFGRWTVLPATKMAWYNAIFVAGGPKKECSVS